MTRSRWTPKIPGNIRVLAVSATLICSAILSAPMAQAATVVPYLAANFDSLPQGHISGAAYAKAFPGSPTADGVYQDMAIVKDVRGGGNILRTALYANTYHSSPNGRQNGAAFSIRLPQSYDRACISYELNFSRAFGFSWGGKLPGLQGASASSGQPVPAAGKPNPYGWSGRIMWLGPGAYRWAGPSNMAVSYMYHPEQTADYGDNVRWNVAFAKGTWHRVQQCYVMNTIGKSDGILRAWMDGVQVVDDNAFLYRTMSDVHITQISWNIFRGGHTSDWASPVDGLVYIDNVQVTSY